MNRELLEKPFEPEQIKQRDGAFGKVLDYVEGHAVIQRLNDALDAKWSFEIIRYQVFEDKDEVLVLGKLTADGIVKTQFGSSKITRAKETGEIISLADDLKAACTDALKKASTLLGVGLHLYNGNGDHKSRPEQSGTDNGNYERRDNAQGGNGGRESRITNRQLNYLVDLGKSIRWNSKDLDAESLRLFGVKMAYLTLKDASAFIESLKAKAA